MTTKKWTRQERYRKAHPEKYREATRRWRERHPDRARQSWREQYTKLRVRVLEQYDNKCNRCGFVDSRALQIDHVYGGGNKEHAVIRNSGVYRRALKQPKEYQLLCANCNWIKKAERQENVPRKD